jgi:hypothetical protein
MMVRLDLCGKDDRRLFSRVLLQRHFCRFRGWVGTRSIFSDIVSFPVCFKFWGTHERYPILLPNREVPFCWCAHSEYQCFCWS